MVKSYKGVTSGKCCEVVTVGRHAAVQSGQPDYGVQWKLTSGKIKGLTILHNFRFWLHNAHSCALCSNLLTLGLRARAGSRSLLGTMWILRNRGSYEATVGINDRSR